MDKEAKKFYFGSIITISLITSFLMYKERNRIIPSNDTKGNKDYCIESLNDYYSDELNIPAEIIERESTQKINDEIYKYLGNRFFAEEDNELYNSDIFYNELNKDLEFRYSKKNEIFAIEYSDDNCRYAIQSVDEKNIIKDYFSKTNEDGFYSISYKNDEEINRKIHYYINDEYLSITLTKNRYSLFVCNNEESLLLYLSEEEFEKLYSIMLKYQNGLNLNDFLNEEEFKKYLDIIKKENFNLYFKLIDKNPKVLKLARF